MPTLAIVFSPQSTNLSGLTPLGGCPLAEYCLQAALNAKGVTAVCLASSDASVNALASKYNAVAYPLREAVRVTTGSERPPEGTVSPDPTMSPEGGPKSVESLCLEVLSSLDERGSHFDQVILLDYSFPLITTKDVEAALEKLATQDADTCIGTTPTSSSVLFTRTGAQPLSTVAHAGSELVVETGALTALRVASVKEHKDRLVGKVVGLDLAPIPQVTDSLGLDIASAELARRQALDFHQLLPPRLKVIAMDFDGVFTDNTVLLDQDGLESVRCHRGDGLGLDRLKKDGYLLVILSKERNPVVTARGRKLGIEVHQGVDDKLPLLTKWLIGNGTSLEETAYVGNDINDVDCLRAAAMGVAVADSHPEARRAANIVLRERGGHGALRELSDLILGKR